MIVKGFRPELAKEVWQVLDKVRGQTDPENIDEVLAAIEDAGIELGHEVVQYVAGVYDPKTSSGFPTPSFFGDLVASLLAGTRIQSVLDPWAGTGALLHSVSEKLDFDTAVGIEPSPGCPTSLRSG